MYPLLKLKDESVAMNIYKRKVKRKVTSTYDVSFIIHTSLYTCIVAMLIYFVFFCSHVLYRWKKFSFIIDIYFSVCQTSNRKLLLTVYSSFRSVLFSTKFIQVLYFRDELDTNEVGEKKQRKNSRMYMTHLDFIQIKISYTISCYFHECKIVEIKCIFIFFVLKCAMNWNRFLSNVIFEQIKLTTDFFHHR